VFRRRKLAGKAPVEFSAFIAIGLAGLALNDLIIYVAVDRFALALLAAKLIAAGASFLFNYTARKLALF
jgi:putative flippase GtrA